MTVIYKFSIVALTLIIASCGTEVDSSQTNNTLASPVAQPEMSPASKDCVIDYGNTYNPSVYKLLKLSAPGGSLKLDIQRTDDKPTSTTVVAAEYVNDDYVYKIIQSASAELTKVEKIPGGVRISGSATLGVQTDMPWKQSARQPVSANLGTTVFENVECMFPSR